MFIINDRSIIRKTEVNEFFESGLDKKLNVTEIEQSVDVLGQKLTAGQDSFYINPQIFYVKELSSR